VTSGRRAPGGRDATRRTVAFVVDADPAAAPRDRQVHAAARLGAALTAAGDHVVLVRAADWTTPAGAPPGLRAVVTTTPRFDPALVPDDVAGVAWVIDHPMSWPGHPALALFDAVLSGSALMRDRLAAALWAAGDTGTPLLGVLPLAADPAPGSPRGRLARLRAPRAPAGPVTVRDAVQAVGGIVPAAVFETLAAGRLPRTTSRLGLAEVGLAGDDVDALRRAVLADHTWERRGAELEAVLAAVARRPRGPRLGFFPDFRETNPYQALLYARLVADGVRVAPVRRVTDSLVLRDTGGDLGGYVLHVHWAEAVAQVVEDPTAARARLDAFTALLQDVRARRGKVVWTVHNVLPHEVRHRDLEIELCRLLAAEADVVHVMGEATPALTRDLYELDPATVEVVPHSSYTGVYPDVISRAAARKRLGVLDHDVALLALGSIRPYRGLDTLLTAFDALLERDLRVKLLVAGRPGRSPEVAAWVERCKAHPRIVTRFGHVPESDLQLWHRAADVAVLPYRGILNSGAFKLTETFGLPVVAPRSGNVAALLDPAYAVGFDPGAEGDLLRALIEAVDLVTDPEAVARAGAVARARAAEYPPAAMAAGFADVMARRCGLGRTPATDETHVGALAAAVPGEA
jgi:glycosyltransferase involved in cell wall biosynthesis